MAFHCMNCNGSMVFDPSIQQMRCEHCDTVCGPHEFDVRDVSTGMATHVCRNCGAELEGTDDSLVGFCPYCGGQSMVMTPGSSVDIEQIIPFQVTREQCIEQYTEYTKHIPYLHKEFKDPEHIKKFTGIYMPYHLFDASFGAPHITGKKVEHGFNYDEYKTYRIDVDYEGEYQHGAPFDASKYLDDEISARCLPFDMAQERPFRPAYLAGFYADASTVPAELYLEDAKAQAAGDLIGEVEEQLSARDRIPIESSSSIETTITGHHSVLFPMWFLTWRKDERVAYAVINGESGKVVSDLPLNLRSFALGCVAISAALFVVLELLVQPTPTLTSFVSLVAAFLMAHGIHVSAKRVHETITHAQDKGWTKDPNGGAGGTRRSSARKADRSAILFAAVLIIVGANFLMRSGRTGINIEGLFDVRSSWLMKGAPVLVLLFSLYVLVKVIGWHKDMQEWNAPIAIGSLLLAVILNMAIIFIAPVNDGWYYIGDAVCIAGLIASSVAMLKVYNLSTTRPLPHLFDREEV